MLVVIPTRIFPGLIASALFCFVGIGTGYVAAVPFMQPGHFKIAHLLFVPVFACCLHFIWKLWRANDSSNAASETTAVSPRILAALGSVCLLVGLCVGGLVAYIS
jgi:hypothetical protein